MITWKLIRMLDKNVEALLKYKVSNNKNNLPKDTWEALKNAKCGLIRVTHSRTGKMHHGITAAFGEGVGCYMSNEDEWFTTSTIKYINWEDKYFETLNSKYFFGFDELDFQELYNDLFGYMDNLKVKIKKLDKNAVIPTYAHPGVDMGMDVTATNVEFDYKTQCFVYHTGLAFEVPKGYGMLIFPRSSNRKTEAYLANHVGILDSSYRGELMLMYKNRDADNHTQPYNIGDRIGQIVIIPYPQVEFEEVDELSETERGEGGFGSTGN